MGGYKANERLPMYLIEKVCYAIMDQGVNSRIQKNDLCAVFGGGVTGLD